MRYGNPRIKCRGKCQQPCAEIRSKLCLIKSLSGKFFLSLINEPEFWVYLVAEPEFAEIYGFFKGAGLDTCLNDEIIPDIAFYGKVIRIDTTE